MFQIPWLNEAASGWYVCYQLGDPGFHKAHDTVGSAGHQRGQRINHTGLSFPRHRRAPESSFAVKALDSKHKPHLSEHSTSTAKTHTESVAFSESDGHPRLLTLGLGEGPKILAPKDLSDGATRQQFPPASAQKVMKYLAGSERDGNWKPGAFEQLERGEGSISSTPPTDGTGGEGSERNPQACSGPMP